MSIRTKIEYQPGVSIGPHDHTFEEAYFILSGEVEAILDGERYLAKAGDVLWRNLRLFWGPSSPR